MKYRVETTPRFEKEFRKLDRYTQRMLKAWIDKNLVDCADPRAHGKGLTANRSGQWRYRIGDYRLLCLIEDEELRAQIKGSGIGTSATRAEILKKLVNIKYLALNGKTQIITPTLLGELVFDVVGASIRQLLNPELTASWEKGLTYVAEGSITPDEYMEKLERFVAGRTYGVLRLNNQYQLREYFKTAGQNYSKK